MEFRACSLTPAMADGAGVTAMRECPRRTTCALGPVEISLQGVPQNVSYCLPDGAGDLNQMHLLARITASLVSVRGIGAEAG
jgi:hypothetical protein